MSEYSTVLSRQNEKLLTEIVHLREQVEKLTKERDDSISDVDTIAQHNIELQQQLAALSEQVEKMTKERDGLRKVTLEQWAQKSITLEQQLVAIAEQNEKMRVALQAMVDEAFARNCGLKIADDALSLPNLATPVLNRIRAEGMKLAAEVCEQISDEYREREGLRYPELKTDAETGASECESAIRARAAELERVQ